MSRLREAAGSAPFVFVAGKGGVGKTTAAGAIALEFADAGSDTHLISTDPAHSLGDLFDQAVGGAGVVSTCSERLFIEEFDAGRAADLWLARALGPVTEIVERGTYLDAEDVAGFSRLALPGVDEMMAVLRLAELASAPRRVVVDTAPAGHTLRLLDAAGIHEGIARALRAMADKAAAVAGAMTGRSLRLSGERIIEELEASVATYRARVLAPAAFMVVTRQGSVVAGETTRLLRDLRTRGLRVAAVIATGTEAQEPVEPEAGLEVPLLDGGVRGCNGLRSWQAQVRERAARTPVPRPVHGRSGPDGVPGPAAQWLAGSAPRLLLFAGKGGVGKSTCAAAAAVTLAGTRDVLLCSTDPAGSIEDVLQTAAIPGGSSRLRVMQIDPSRPIERVADAYRTEISAALDRLGLSESAELDRRVIAALWDLAPPGIDELAATAAMLSAARPDETVVIDSAPTGHFLRLLEMPEVGLGWTRQLMRVIVKYRLGGIASGAAQSLLELSRELKALNDALHDERSAAVVVVTLDEPMVRAETDRLIETLARAHVHVGAVLLNRAAAPPRAADAAHRLIIAPDCESPPVGAADLRRFVDRWKIVA